MPGTAPAAAGGDAGRSGTLHALVLEDHPTRPARARTGAGCMSTAKRPASTPTATRSSS